MIAGRTGSRPPSRADKVHLSTVDEFVCSFIYLHLLKLAGPEFIQTLAFFPYRIQERACVCQCCAKSAAPALRITLRENVLFPYPATGHSTGCVHSWCRFVAL